MSHRRNEALARIRVLPGSVPYTNRRRLNVGGRFDGLTLADFLAQRHAHIEASVWAASASAGRLEIDGAPVHDLERIVRAGNQLVHIIPDEVEPPVAHDLRVVYEDPQLLALHKPAPLPVHPSGRFNKNTVVGLLAVACPDLAPHPVHRLDADTTGLLLMAKTPEAARHLGAQFEARRVDKRYLARIHGAPLPDAWTIDRPVRRSPDATGKRTATEGAAARTHVRVVERGAESLIEVAPSSGRTNQIRVHLAADEHPIVGDQAYGPDAQDAFMSGGPLCLHAWSITVRHPDDERLCTFTAPPPAWASTAVARE
ncbi:MAG: RluA family pseudouridine synthase [Myxococcota bacterium]